MTAYFGSHHRRRWATIEFTKSGYSLSTSEEGPDGETDLGAAPEAVFIDFETTAPRQKPMKAIRIPIPGEDMENGLSTEIPIKLPSGETFSFFVEVFIPTADDQVLGVTIEISKDEDECLFSMRCESGLLLTCLLGGYVWIIRIGAGPWG